MFMGCLYARSPGCVQGTFFVRDPTDIRRNRHSFGFWIHQCLGCRHIAVRCIVEARCVVAWGKASLGRSYDNGYTSFSYSYSDSCNRVFVWYLCIYIYIIMFPSLWFPGPTRDIGQNRQPQASWSWGDAKPEAGEVEHAPARSQEEEWLGTWKSPHHRGYLSTARNKVAKNGGHVMTIRL